MEAIILQAVSGAGKSTLARKMAAEDMLGTKIVSADDYFIAEDGSYRWEASQLGAAHTHCFAAYLTALRAEYYLKRVIVDNTNLNPADVSPYVMAAKAYGWPWKILQVGCDPEVAAARNVHGLTRSKVLKQYERLQNFMAPKEWWPHVEAAGDLAFVSNLARRNVEQQLKVLEKR